MNGWWFSLPSAWSVQALRRNPVALVLWDEMNDVLA